MAEIPRFFVDSGLLQRDTVELTGEALHHLRVLRLSPGATLCLLDGCGSRCLARLEQIGATGALARLLTRQTALERPLSVTLLQGLPKGDKFELILQKGTELGVGVFQPLATERAVPAPPAARLATRQKRWQTIVREACRQSRRDLLPEVRSLCPLATALDQIDGSALRLMLWEDGARPLAAALPAPPAPPPVSVALLVGPEGGFSAAEAERAGAAGFQPVHLGPRILRTETAGLAVTAILQYLYGDWQATPVD
ncbi:MAG: 16S rRNA (uracil(1498)-N(3))-methyltransferase [Desulfuromonadales bacterium]|nr:16S rRNA (uracil(1498)-N(3))-methyltransferase [Desulfuromonadales bacterium]